MAKHPPPESFEAILSVPERDYLTAIAIRHEGRMREVPVTFLLRQHDGEGAAYAAICPRCNTGEILVDVALNGEGGFAEPPACPSLCLACEDALDAILEPAAATSIGDEPGDRETLRRYLKAMTIRSWD
jgi:hypothetical protein